MIFAEVEKEKDIYLFDTFEGLPQDASILLKKGDLPASSEKVKELFRDYANVHVFKGLFPDTSTPINDKNFSFVHLDADLYEGTLRSLEFFYERMAEGGLIVVHDYPNLKGVKLACDEFFGDKPEKILPLFFNQCVIVKR